MTATDLNLAALLERARHDLLAGWPEAACDAIGRALRLLDPDPDPDRGTDAASNRPAERAVLRAAAVELAARGLTALDIAAALGLSEAAARVLLEGAR
ncbi:MAG: hypothetical protein M0038_19790 [Pseudomonadota bacterium]|jgi:hypothetical protein|nr:hypothetical protein [Pseudomonadota bacterium]